MIKNTLKIFITLLILTAVVVGVKSFLKIERIKNINVYFVKVKKEQGVEFLPVVRTLEKDQKPFQVAIKELISGPSEAEKQNGIYSEIPTETKLLGIKEDAQSFTINLSRNFEYGGGSDSVRTRVFQLVKTATEAAKDKDVYLEIEGEKADVISGEGFIVKQPLKGNL